MFKAIRRRIEWRILNEFFDWMPPGSFTEAIRAEGQEYVNRGMELKDWGVFPDLNGHTKDW